MRRTKTTRRVKIATAAPVTDADWERMEREDRAAFDRLLQARNLEWERQTAALPCAECGARPYRTGRGMLPALLWVGCDKPDENGDVEPCFCLCHRKEGLPRPKFADLAKGAS